MFGYNEDFQGFRFAFFPPPQKYNFLLERPGAKSQISRAGWHDGNIKDTHSWHGLKIILNAKVLLVRDHFNISLLQSDFLNQKLDIRNKHIDKYIDIRRKHGVVINNRPEAECHDSIIKILSTLEMIFS